MNIKLNLFVKKLEEIVEGDITRMPNTKEIVDKVNELVDIINNEIYFGRIKRN